MTTEQSVGAASQSTPSIAISCRNRFCSGSCATKSRDSTLFCRLFVRVASTFSAPFRAEK